MSRAFAGWLPDPGPPFREPVLVPYAGRPIILIGPNGYGKTRLLRAIVDRRTPRLFTAPPPRLAPYLTLARRDLEKGSRTARGDRELFVDAEETRAQDDDLPWWRARLRADDLWWATAPPTSPGPGELCGVTPEAPFDPLVRIPASSRHLGLAAEPWIRPGEVGFEELDAESLRTFRAWATAVLSTGTVKAAVPANPLVATVPGDRSVSLLTLAETFCALLADRAARRLHVLAGFDLELRCLPAENFAWQINADGSWISLALASRAVSRWCTLAATETLRELLQCAKEAEETQIPTDTDRTLAGDLDLFLLPPGEPGAFATRSTWVAMDEPEVNLFAPEAGHLAATLAGRTGPGRTLIATHSLDFAARFVGVADFLMFDGPGRYAVDRPADGIAELLSRLSAHGSGALAATRVLYVEGDWDVELLTRLHGAELDRANVLLSRMHGVKGAGIAASSVWQRLTSTSFGMMFDHLGAEVAGRRWERVRQTLAGRGRAAALAELRAGIRARRGPFEDQELLRLFASILEGGIEDRLRLVMHGLSDIFEVMHPSVFGLTGADWAGAGYDRRSSFKNFLRVSAGVDLTDGRECRRRLDAFDAADRPVEARAATALRHAVEKFIHE